MKLPTMSADAHQHNVRALYFELGLALTARDRHAEAVTAFEQAALEQDADPSAAVVRLQLAAAYVRAGHVERALRSYLEIVCEEPHRTIEALTHAHALLTPDVAVPEGEWIQRDWAQRARAAVQTPADHVAVLSFLGRVKLHLRSFAEARDLFAEARASAPDDPYVLEGLGEALWKTRDLVAAVESLSRAERLAAEQTSSRLPAVTAKLSQVFAARGEYEAAFALIERHGIGDNRYAYELHLVRGECALGVGKPADALAAAERAATMRPRAVEPHLLRTRALIALGRDDEAVRSANDALQSDPSNEQVAGYRAQALIEGQIDIAQGRRLLKRQADVAGGPPDADFIRSVLHGRAEEGNAHYFIAERHAAFGRADAALAAVNHALELGLLAARTPAEAPAHQLKGELLADRNDRVGAALSFYDAGSAFLSRGDYRQAIDNLRRAVALAPDKRTWWLLADALRLSDDPAKPRDAADALAESLAAWNNGAALGLPVASESWAYSTRALIAEQQARTQGPETQAALAWEGVVYVERAILLQRNDEFRWALLGRYHRSLENELNAIHASGQAVTDSPNDPFALEEKAAALANNGRFADAEEAIAKRLSIEETAWAKGVHAYVLLHLHRYDEALSAIEIALQREPQNLWNLDLRALCYRALGRRDLALEDYATIWKGYDPADVGNLATFANAAYHLGQLEDALAIYERVCADARQGRCGVNASLGLAYLGTGDLGRAEERLQFAAASAINARELDDLLEFDLPDAERAWSRSDEARAVLQRTRDRIAARRADLVVPRSAESELRAVVANLVDARQTDDWAWIGANAGVARLLAEAEAWTDAVAIYRDLERFRERFPEANVGLTAIVDELASRGHQRVHDGHVEAGIALLQESLSGARTQNRTDMVAQLHTEIGDLLLRQDDPRSAREHFEQAAALEPTTSDPRRSADLHARLGYVAFALGDGVSARFEFAAALGAYRVANEAEPGASLGEVSRSLLTDISKYWALESVWHAWASEAHTDLVLRNDLQAARATLVRYVDDAYELGPKPDLVAMFPVVTPVVLELGSGLIAEDSSTEAWSLFTHYIPQLRDRVRAETGVGVPGVRVRANPSLAPGDYVIMIDEIPRARGSVHLGMRYSPEPAERWHDVAAPQYLVEERNPRTHRPGFWVAPEAWERAAALNLDLWAEPLVFVVHHLEATLRRNLGEFVGVQEFETLLDAWRGNEHASSLIRELTPDESARLRLARVVRALVRDRVPLKAPEDILEAVAEQGLTSGTDAEIVAGVRARIGKWLPGNSRTAQRVELPVEWQEKLLSWVQQSNGGTWLKGPVVDTEELLAVVRAAFDPLGSDVVLIAPRIEVQPLLRRLIAPEFPDVMVLAREEVLSQELPSSIASAPAM